MSDKSVLQDKFIELQNQLNRNIIGHPEMTSSAIYALLTGEHAVLIGPAGTAKTMIINLLTNSIEGINTYSYLLTKYTEYSELFGSLDINSLAQGVYKRNWSGLINSHIIFLDEIFKANSAILNALLSLLNERRVYDPMTGGIVSSPLLSAFGASNETPDTDSELTALYDRFMIKVFVDYLENQDQFFTALENVWLNTNNANTKILSLTDIKNAQQEVQSLIKSSITLSQKKTSLLDIYGQDAFSLIKSLRSKGVMVSDRTAISKLPKLFAAYLWLNSKDGKISLSTIQNWVFELAPFLARNEGEQKEIKKALNDMLGEVAELQQKLQTGIDLMKAMNFNEARSKFIEVLQSDISRIPDYLVPRAEVILKQARQYIQRIDQIQTIVNEEEADQK